MRHILQPQSEYNTELAHRLDECRTFLTRAEATIVELMLVEGLDDEDIASRLKIKKTTVIQQRSRFMEKIEKHGSQPRAA